MVDRASAPHAASRLLHFPDDVRELVDSMQDVFYRVDAQDRLVVVSRSALKVLGYRSVEEMLGRPASTFWAYPDRRAAFLAALEKHGELNDWEADLVRQDRTLVHVATTVRTIRDECGASIGYQGVWRDITERKLAEEALRQSEERSAKIFLTVPDTITLSRASDGKLIDANPGFEKATGWPRAEVLGRTTLDLNLWVEPRQRDRLVQHLRDHGELLDGELTFRRRDGVHREGIYSARSIDIAGEHCVVFIMRDVTERTRAEAALRLQERRLIQALEGAELGTWDWVVPTNQLVVNDRWAEMIGFRREEVTHDSFWQDRVHPEDMPHVDARQKAHLVGHASSYEVEYRLRHRDGRWVWVLSKGRVLERDTQGRPYRMCGTHLDISERKQLEADRASMETQLRQAQKLEAVGQIAGGVAHDFNNLLTVQISNLHLLAGVPGLPADAREMLSDIEHAAQAAAALTGQLLAFGRRQVLQPVRVDLNEVVAGFLRMLRRVVRENVRVTFEVGDQPLLVDADVGMLQQIVMNLAVNAQDAMPAGGLLSIKLDAVELAAQLQPNHADARPGRFVRLLVSDTGYGMDDVTQRRAFDPFFTTKPVGQGTGLGLATVYGIVKQHGGFIELETAPGKGAEFRIHWPRAADGHVPTDSHEAPSPMARGAGETVLLVEDEPTVRRTLRATLLQLGYQVVEAADAEKALAVSRDAATRVDVLLSDVVMPGLSGVELARCLRLDRPRVPVVLMSGYSADLAAVGLPDGIGFLKKPIEPANLASMMKSAVAQAR